MFLRVHPIPPRIRPIDIDEPPPIRKHHVRLLLPDRSRLRRDVEIKREIRIDADRLRLDEEDVFVPRAPVLSPRRRGVISKAEAAVLHVDDEAFVDGDFVAEEEGGEGAVGAYVVSGAVVDDLVVDVRGGGYGAVLDVEDAGDGGAEGGEAALEGVDDVGGDFRAEAVVGCVDAGRVGYPGDVVSRVRTGHVSYPTT